MRSLSTLLVSSKKLEIRYVLLTAFAALIGLVVQNPSIYASAETTTQATPQSYNFTTITGDDLKNNPIAQKILKNIEISKQRITELQKHQKEMTEQQKFIEEQRRIVKENLQKDLNRMYKDQEPYTPKNSFARFVARDTVCIAICFCRPHRFAIARTQNAN